MFSLGNDPAFDKLGDTKIMEIDVTAVQLRYRQLKDGTKFQGLVCDVAVQQIYILRTDHAAWNKFRSR